MTTNPPVPPEGATLAERIDARLPQTQCEQCGHHGCRAYAEAVAADTADINQCPPGGHELIESLASLLQREPKPLNPEHGIEKPRQLARIVEADCIGCTKCIQACPVDAIVGAPKRMHTVLADQCTGCELCVPACPVDCIVLEPMPESQQDAAHANAARQHFRQREDRLARQRREREDQLARRKATLHRHEPDPAGSNVHAPLSRGGVQAAIERARAKRAGREKNRGNT